MRDLILSNIKSPLDQVTALPFLLEAATTWTIITAGRNRYKMIGSS